MKRARILIVDDDPHVRAGLRRRLRAWGYAVEEAADGLAALRICPTGGVDLVLLDHGLPKGDGRTIARMLRKESEVPIVFISGYHREGFRSIVRELPEVYYLAKPCQEDALRTLLASLLKRPEPVGR